MAHAFLRLRLELTLAQLTDELVQAAADGRYSVLPHMAASSVAVAALMDAGQGGGRGEGSPMAATATGNDAHTRQFIADGLKQLAERGTTDLADLRQVSIELFASLQRIPSCTTSLTTVLDTVAACHAGLDGAFKNQVLVSAANVSQARGGGRTAQQVSRVDLQARRNDNVRAIVRPDDFGESAKGKQDTPHIAGLGSTQRSVADTRPILEALMTADLQRVWSLLQPGTNALAVKIDAGCAKSLRDELRVVQRSIINKVNPGGIMQLFLERISLGGALSSQVFVASYTYESFVMQTARSLISASPIMSAKLDKLDAHESGQWFAMFTAFALRESDLYDRRLLSVIQGKVLKSEAGGRTAVTLHGDIPWQAESADDIIGRIRVLSLLCSMVWGMTGGYDKGWEGVFEDIGAMALRMCNTRVAPPLVEEILRSHFEEVCTLTSNTYEAQNGGRPLPPRQWAKLSPRLTAQFQSLQVSAAVQDSAATATHDSMTAPEGGVACEVYAAIDTMRKHQTMRQTFGQIAHIVCWYDVLGLVDGCPFQEQCQMKQFHGRKVSELGINATKVTNYVTCVRSYMADMSLSERLSLSSV